VRRSLIVVATCVVIGLILLVIVGAALLRNSSRAQSDQLTQARARLKQLVDDTVKMALPGADVSGKESIETSSCALSTGDKQRRYAVGAHAPGRDVALVISRAKKHWESRGYAIDATSRASSDVLIVRFGQGYSATLLVDAESAFVRLFGEGPCV
jgi:hypothetical protein